jgi:hypothetical protein
LGKGVFGIRRLEFAAKLLKEIVSVVECRDDITGVPVPVCREHHDRS